jgi:hypothetical protein
MELMKSEIEINLFFTTFSFLGVVGNSEIFSTRPNSIVNKRSGNYEKRKWKFSSDIFI